MGVCESQEDATAWAESVPDVPAKSPPQPEMNRWQVDIETIFDHIEADQVWEVEHFIEYAPTQKLSSKVLPCDCTIALVLVHQLSH